MPLTYDSDSKIKDLAPVLDEHADWFGQSVRQLFYPEQYGAGIAVSLPKSFSEWVKVARESADAINPVFLNDLVRIHDDLHKTSSELIAAAAKAGVNRPNLKSFDHLINLYDEFVRQIHRLERDIAQTDSGIDPLTGLRSRKAMERDLERELERRSRRGLPFCIVLVRIDDSDSIRNSAGIGAYETVQKEVAVLIRKCVRSFDDAYRINDTDFIMALKHADTTGGSAAIARLRGYLKETPVSVRFKDKAIDITLSYCAGEPMPGDNIEGLLTNMSADLSRYDAEQGLTIEYADQSPLQRYIQESGDKKE